MTFAFNDDEYCHWLYDWNSGTSQRERARLHYFRVYVFRRAEGPASSPQSSGSSLRAASRENHLTGQARRHEDKRGDSWWEVADVVSSPGFTISAFRKEASTPSVGDALPAAVQGGSSPMDSPSSQDVVTGDDSAVSSQPRRVIQQQYSENDRRQAQVFMDQWARAHPDVVGKSTKLAIAALVLSQLDIAWIDPTYFSNNLFSLLRQWPASPPVSSSASPGMTQQREDALWLYVSAVVPKILGLMTAMAEGSSRPPSPSSSSSLQHLAEFAEIGFSLFGHILADTSWSNMRGLLARQADESTQFDQTEMEVVERLIFAVAGFHESLEFHTSAWLTRRGLSLESLVDDLVSCVLMDRGCHDLFPASLDRYVLSLLRNEGLLGVQLLDYQFHELRWAASTLDHSRAMQRPTRTSVEATRVRPCRLNGTWVCRDMDIDHVDPLARSVSRPRGPNERVRLGVALMALLLSVGFNFELKEAASDLLGRLTRRQDDVSLDDEDMDDEESEPDSRSQQQRPKLLLEVSAFARVFPEIKEQLELDGDLRLLPALGNGLVPSWLGGLVFPFDDGVMDYSAYVVATSSGHESQQQEAGLEFFLSFFYYASDGSAWRLRVNLSEAASVPRRTNDSQMKVLVQIAVGNSGVAIGSDAGSQRERVDWRRVTPRERHDEIDGWESLTAFEMLYDQLARGDVAHSSNPMEVETRRRATPSDEGRSRSLSTVSASRSRNQSGFALV